MLPPKGLHRIPFQGKTHQRIKIFKPSKLTLLFEKQNKIDLFFALCTFSQVQVWLKTLSRSSVTAEISLRASSTSRQTSQPRLVLGWVGDELKLPPPVRNWKIMPCKIHIPFSLRPWWALKSFEISSYTFKPVSVAGLASRPADKFCFWRHWDEWGRGAVNRPFWSVSLHSH